MNINVTHGKKITSEIKLFALKWEEVIPWEYFIFQKLLLFNHVHISEINISGA